MSSRLLCVKPLEKVSKTAAYILKEFEETLESYNIPTRERNTIITDQGSENTGSEGIRQFYEREDCCCHLLGTVLRRTISKTTTTTKGVRSQPFYKYFDEAPGLFRLMDCCYKIGEYFKRARLNYNLSHSIKVPNETRWLGKYECFSSILKSYDEIVQVLTDKNKTNFLLHFDRDLLADWVDVLHLFRDATLLLEPFKTPTLQKICYIQMMLIGNLTQVSTQNKILIEIVTSFIFRIPGQKHIHRNK